MYHSAPLSNYYVNDSEKHPYHLVDPSPWPINVAFAALSLTFGFVMWFHDFQEGLSCVHCGLVSLLYFVYSWFQDIITESVYQGHHTRSVVQGLSYGVLLFIVSEIMFFFSFFWAWFYYTISASIWTGGDWLPQGHYPAHSLYVPLTNTVLLLLSGVTLTAAHSEFIAGLSESALDSLAFTLCLAVYFLCFQYVEYEFSSLHINDSVHGSAFYLITGFHGFHVLIGTLFIFSCFLSVVEEINTSFTAEHHFFFVAALWYWHFVDVVWVFVFIFLYISLDSDCWRLPLDLLGV